MKKYRIVVAGLSVLLTLPIIKAGASGTGKDYSIDKLVQKYIASSSQSERNRIASEQQSLDWYTIANSITELEQQIESNNRSINNLESGKGSGTYYEQRYQADYQRVYGYELEMKLAHYKMQEQLDLLYDEYAERITNRQTKQLELEAYRLLWNIKTNEEKTAYLEGVKSQKEHELAVVRETLNLGYATESNVLAVEAELEQAKAELVACIDEQNLLLKKYELAAKESFEQIAAEYVEAEYSAESVLKEFKQNSFYTEYYQKQAEIYKNYAETLEKQKSEMKNYSYNQEYFERVQKYIADESAYYSNEAALAENSAECYSESLELFADETYRNVETLSAQRKAALASLKAVEKQLEISRILLEEGRINKTPLMEAENNVLKHDFELSKIEAEIMCLRYAIDNHIENFGN